MQISGYGMEYTQYVLRDEKIGPWKRNTIFAHVESGQRRVAAQVGAARGREALCVDRAVGCLR